ncbi:MAG: RidA family protein [Alphaproteobacteria bacterium]|nr:RidA family protein [Alphaproteobacteria bacterium]
MIIERLDVGERISRAVIHGDTIYLAGQATPDPVGDIAGQTTVVLQKIDDLLARCDSNKNQILFAQIHLTDMAGFDDMNRAWVAWAPKPALPARTVVEARLPKAEFLVEITVIAAR